MSGCCGQSPVIVNGAQPARVDVETLLMCDVLADGTVAGTALVEPIYDTVSGERVGTRTVDPVTGAAYTPQGTLRPCQPENCTANTTAQLLCDIAADGTATPFVRATTYDCGGELLATLDRTLDGVVYTVVGTVGVCPAVPDCEQPTTPTATVGLCLVDGTPIAVTVIRDCQGVITSEGWLNLRTGAWTAGAVPAGTVACGDSQSVQVSGTFCDVDAAGDVVGLVLVEYSYAADGTIDSVRLVDAVTGTTYTPTGTVTVCPAGVEQPEQDAVLLCDTAADGTVTQFLRDYRRDELGAITAHSDYTLDGAAYVPTGTIGICSKLCLNCETFGLADSTPQPSEVNATAVDAAPTLWSGTAASKKLNVGVSQDLWNGGVVVFPQEQTAGDTYAIATLTGGGCICDADAGGTVSLTISVDVTNNGPNPGQGGDAFLEVYNGEGTSNLVLAGFSPGNTSVGTTVTLTGSGTAPLADYLAGNLHGIVHLETNGGGPKSWTARNLTITATTAAAGCGNRFKRTVCRDCDGAIVSTTDTTDGTTPYVPVGAVAVPHETDCSCLDCETLVLCDAAGNDPALITGIASSGTLSNGVVWQARGNNAAHTASKSNADGSWWRIGSFPNVTVPPDTWTFDRPVYAEFSVSMRYFAGGVAGADNTTQMPPGIEVVSLPSGYHYDAVANLLTVDNTVTDCAIVNAPTQALSARFRTINPVTSFTLRYLGARIANCGEFGNWNFGGIVVTPTGQFLRSICRSCDGSVVSMTDTTLDGAPYTVLGVAGVCAEEPPCDKSVLSECVYRLPDTVTGFDAEQTTFPGCWLGTALNPTYAYGNRVTSWEGTYDSSTGTVSNVGFTSPDLGGVINAAAFVPAIPAGPAQSSPAYQGTLVINGITVTLTAVSGNGLSTNGTLLALNPGDRVRIEFSEPVRLTVITGAFADPPTPHNERLCGVVAATVPWQAVKLADCEGVITVVDSATMQPLPATAAVDCDCCTPGPVCIGQNPEQTIHFITNEEHLEDNSVDPVWKWSLTPDDPAATWYDMYEGAHGFVGAWTVKDTDTERPAWWLSAHPNGASAQSVPPLPGEGPSLLNTHWYARSFFDLPAGADPGSIQIQVTVLNADQFGRAFRLNNGPWQPLPANACYSVGNGCVAYTFGPGSIPGAQAGRNYLYLDVEETVGGGSGLMAHLIVTYQIGRPEQRSWTRMVCCDDTVYYLDENGDRQAALPDGWSVVPCGITSHPVVLCDDLGTFLRHITYTADGQVLISDTDALGAPYSTTGTVHACT